MLATIASDGQITIPERIRQKLGIKPGDQIDFDEHAPVLIGRKVPLRMEWNRAFEEWKSKADETLCGHPWESRSAAELVDELRGGPVEATDQ